MANRIPVSTSKDKETCILVGLTTQNQTREQLTEYLEELAFLVRTADAVTKKLLFSHLQNQMQKHLSVLVSFKK